MKDNQPGIYPYVRGKKNSPAFGGAGAVPLINMNNPGITIEDVNLQIEKGSGHIEGKVRVVIRLKNSSKTLTYYVLKRPRTIDYDQGSHTLSIGLYEKELPQGVQVDSSPFEPEQVAILPDTTFDWQYLVPVWMKKIVRSPGLREVVEVVDISAVQKVVCTVAYRSRQNPGFVEVLLDERLIKHLE